MQKCVHQNDDCVIEDEKKKGSLQLPVGLRKKAKQW